MPEDTTPSDSAGATPTPSTPAKGTPPSGATPQGLTLEEALAQIAELTRHASNKDEEAKRHGKNLTEAQKKLAAYEEQERAAQEAALSELEKSNKRAADAEAKVKQYQTQLVLAEVRMAAKDRGVFNPKLIAHDVQEQLKYGDDGMPTNLDTVLDALIQANPFLVPAKAEPAPAPAAATVPTPNAPTIPAMNTGRSSIAAPGTLPTGKPTRLSDIDWSRR